MRFPGRKFLHLAAGSVALQAVSRPVRAQMLFERPHPAFMKAPLDFEFYNLD